MIAATKLCPLSFASSGDRFKMRCPYIQRFGIGDKIGIQLTISQGMEVVVTLMNADTMQVVELVSGYGVDGVYETQFIPKDGMYIVEARSGNIILVSNIVEVTESEKELGRYIVVDYGEENRLFRLRVEGGFLCDSDTLGLDNEFFRNRNIGPIQLYQQPYIKNQLIMGNAVGVPLWMGTLLNNLLCCEKVMIDGVEYVRSESSVPERVKIGSERYPLFQFVTVLERDIESVNCDIFNIPILRMIDDDLFRLIANGGWRRL